MLKKGTERFIIVLSIVTLVIVITGATFAYFTATARSEEEAVNTASHFVQIAYNEGKIMRAFDLIPAKEEVAMFGYHSVKKVSDNEYIVIDNEQCIDDNKEVICGTYSFDVTNLGSIEQHLGGFILISSNPFTNLKFALFNVTNVVETDPLEVQYENRVLVSSGELPCNYDMYGKLEGTTSKYIMSKDYIEQIIKPNETAKYEIVVWLEETGEPQDEQGMTFTGSVYINLSDEQHIQGFIEKAE